MRVAPILLTLLVLTGDGSLDELRARLCDRDPIVRESAVMEIAELEGEGASSLLAKALADKESAVRSAAVRALGGRRDEQALKALRGALRRFSKDPALLPAVVVSLGASGDDESAGEIADLLRKALGADPRLSRAVIDTLGRLCGEDSVAGLMEALSASADPRGADHPEYRDEVIESLRETTGLPFREPASWREWWRHAKGNYRPAREVPLEERTEYRNDAWRFSIERPEGDRWVFERVDGAAMRVAWCGPKDEAVFAWVDVLARSAREPKPVSLEEAARGCRAWMEDELHDVRDAKWFQRDRLSGRPAILHEATGILSGGSVLRWRAYVLVHNDLVLTVSAHVESGASEAVGREVDRIVGSFRLLDR